ncbi:MAG: uracil-DNA glycosylase [Candidatus Daviesbacteria bacterium]
MDKQEQLTQLKKEMQADKSLPLRNSATQLVFGEGSATAKIYFLGEAPGYWEDQKGRPFVGQAGQLLDEMLESIGILKKDVYSSSQEARRASSAYISNIVRFRPPENRDPEPQEIAAFAPFIDKEIEIIDPKIIVTLGRFSMGKFFPYEKISKVHGKPKEITWHGKKIMVIPMYHPAAALRNSDIMVQIKEDFKKIPEILEKVSQEKITQQSLF